jgi:Ca2+:H+ antiporter
LNDRFYNQAVLPYSWISAAALFLSYVIGLLFTLRTHAAVIWSADTDEKKVADLPNSLPSAPYQLHESPEALTRQPTLNSSAPIATSRTDIRDSPVYQRILGQSLKQFASSAEDPGKAQPDGDLGSIKSPHIVPPKSRDGEMSGLHLHSLSDAENQRLTRTMAEMAAAAVTVAARGESTRGRGNVSSGHNQRPPAARLATTVAEAAEAVHADAQGVTSGGHDAPNWSRNKSAVILLTATIAYAVIAEILVNTVDAVLNNIDIDEKFLGITLFALVPNTTEFLVCDAFLTPFCLD